MRFKSLSLLPALAVILGLVALPATSAAADTTTTLPLSNFYQMVVDSSQGYLFFSEGSPLGSSTDGANSILVTNLDGNPVTTITGLDGVKGLALSSDGSTLYAALSGDDEISVISTSTLKQTSAYSTGSGNAPWNLAMEDGILWVGYLPSGTPSGSVGYVDPDAADPTLVTPNLAGNGFAWRFAPYISADPSNTSASSTSGTLVVTGSGNTPTTVYSYGVSGTTVSSSNGTGIEYSCSPEYGLAVLPGGSQFIIDCGGDTLYDTATMAPSPGESNYNTSGASSLAIAANGAVAIGNIQQSVPDQASLTDLYTFPEGSFTARPATGYALDTTSSYLTPDGLAWDGTELFALMTDGSYSGGTVTGYSLESLYPGVSTPSLTIATSASTAKYGSDITITATLGKTDTNRTVSLYETPVGGTAKAILTHTVNSKGQLSGVVTMDQSASYTASFAGDAEYAPVTTPAKTVDIDARVSESISGNYSTSSYYRVYHHTAKVATAVTVAPDKHGECVKLEIQRISHDAWKAYAMTGCLALNSLSKAATSLTLTKYPVDSKYRVRADYVRSSSDTKNLSTDSGWDYFIVNK